MLDLRWNIVLLSFTMHSLAAQTLRSNKLCGPPETSVANGKMHSSTSIRQKYAPGERVFYICVEGATTASGRGSAVYSCVAGKWTPLSTCETAQTRSNKLCGPPETSVANGKMHSSTSIRQKYAPGEKVFYMCVEGATTASGRGSAVYSCMAGKWTPLSTCEKTVAEKPSCGNIGLPNGRFESISGGERAQAVCNEGYTLKGSEFLTCTGGEWSGEVPTCEEVTCPQPEVSSHVQVGGGSPVYRQGDSVTFTCDPSFIHTGAHSATCGADGAWTAPPPHCLPSAADEPMFAGRIFMGGARVEDVRVTCKAPKAPNHLIITHLQGSKRFYAPGDSLSFSCTDGRRLNGSDGATCGPDGKWSPLSLPKCFYVTCSSPAVDNSVSTGGADAAYSVRETVTITCKPGFQPDGPPQVTCGAAGQWQPRLPRCLPSATVRPTARPTTASTTPTTTTSTVQTKAPGQCDAPRLDDKPNILLQYDYITQKEFPAGSRVRYECDLGYVPAGGSSYRHCIRGQWTRLTLRCELKSCGSAGEISNGQFMYTGSEFGDSATAVCDEGYDLVGHKTRRCMSSGLWDGRIPVCEVVHCPEPPSARDAVLSGSYEPYTFRSVVSYRCLKGTLTGSRQLWCTQDGTWSSPPPTCRDISCPDLPHSPNMSRSGTLRPPYKPRDAVSFHCGRGSVLVGSSTISCGIDGQWSSNPPVCNSRDYRYHG